MGKEHPPLHPVALEVSYSPADRQQAGSYSGRIVCRDTLNLYASLLVGASLLAIKVCGRFTEGFVARTLPS
ncbi:hypothetical protein [Stutzerimonas stutzeri]|uniref:hypothetical protein n=1 Tax=Stutzerimonas stutzeri TaxID=316 RepID=UPI0021087F55|nr:hypothetical protein [Stutzerimonas stutzeri]MCQ4260000.1 hypothetical protein [Stutzerimonas stutzeri]